MLVALWGNGGGSVATSVTTDGESEFSGIRDSIFSTFQLPWPGTDVVTEKEPLAPSDPESPEEKDEEDEKGTDQRGSRPDKASGPRPKLPQPRVIKAGDLERRLRQLDAWEDKRPLEDAPFWNQQVWLAISDLPWPQMGIPYFLWRKLITPNLVVLAGTGQPRGGHLVIPRETWVLRGLRGFLSLRQQAGSQEIELSFRYSARFRRRFAEPRCRPYRCKNSGLPDRARRDLEPGSHSSADVGGTRVATVLLILTTR